MKSRLVKSSKSVEFVAATWNGSNESGYQPLGDMVLIAPDSASSKSSGGVEFTATHVARETMAAESGVIVALGSDAFLWNADRTRRWEGMKPEPGDRVHMQRYSGQEILGKDGTVYRLCEQNCIGAIEIRERDPEAEAIRYFEALHDCVHESDFASKHGLDAWNKMPESVIISDDKGRRYAPRVAILDALWLLPADHPVRSTVGASTPGFDWDEFRRMRVSSPSTIL